MQRRRITPEEAFNRLANLCVKGERCSFDMYNKLRLSGLPRADIDRVISDLVDQKYIDDTRYAHAFVRDKYRFQHWGRRRIIIELRRRRISADVIREALEEIIEDDYIRYATETVRTRLRSLGDNAGEFEGRQKLFRYAVSRGYEPEIVIAIIRTVISSEDTDDI